MDLNDKPKGKRNFYYKPPPGKAADDVHAANPGEFIKLKESAVPKKPDYSAEIDALAPVYVERMKPAPPAPPAKEKAPVAAAPAVSRPTLEAFVEPPEPPEPTERPGPGRAVGMTTAQKDFIRKNIGSHSIDDIAKALGVSIKAVMSCVDRIRRQIKLETEQRRDSNIREDLLAKPFYPILKRQFNSVDLEFFTREWIATIKQFNEDLYPTEEAELKDMIVLEIMKNHALQTNMDLKQRKDILGRSLARAEAESQLDMGVITNIKVEIQRAEESSKQNLAHFKDLTEKSKRAREALSASRQQRVTKIQDAKANFTEWLRAIYDNENRERVAREMELMKMALHREEERLGSFTEFADKKIDIPLLNSETVALKEFAEDIDDRPSGLIYEDKSDDE